MPRAVKLIFWLVSNLIGRLEAETTNEKRVLGVKSENAG